MTITKFDQKIADASTGGMRDALKKINSLMGAAMASVAQAQQERQENEGSPLRLSLIHI